MKGNTETGMAGIKMLKILQTALYLWVNKSYFMFILQTHHMKMQHMIQHLTLMTEYTKTVHHSLLYSTAHYGVSVLEFFIFYFFTPLNTINSFYSRMFLI